MAFTLKNQPLCSASLPFAFLLMLIVITFQIPLGSSSTSILSRGPPKILGRDFKPLQVVTAGQEFKVSCPIEADPSPIIDWFKDGEPITSAWPRFRLSLKSLRIRSVLGKDSGIYECKGVNGFGSIIARTRLIVADDGMDHTHGGNTNERVEDSVGTQIVSSQAIAPIFTLESLEQAGPLHISSGNSIRFKCGIVKGGSANSKIMWFKDGKATSDRISRWNSWSLLLAKLTSEDSGSYTCRASNAFGRNEFTIQLEITELIERKKPKFVPGYPTNATVLGGGRAVLECIVRGGLTALPPHIKWLKHVPDADAKNELSRNKHLIPVDDKHFLVIQSSERDGIRVNESQINGTFLSTLIFTKAVSRLHGGVYVCLATNSMGYTYKDAHLTVLTTTEVTREESGLSSSSPSGIQSFPLIVCVMSVVLSLLVTGSACCLRNYQKGQEKKTKIPEKVTSVTTGVFLSGTGSTLCSSSFSSSAKKLQRMTAKRGSTDDSLVGSTRIPLALASSTICPSGSASLSSFCYSDKDHHRHPCGNNRKVAAMVPPPPPTTTTAHSMTVASSSFSPASSAGGIDFERHHYCHNRRSCRYHHPSTPSSSTCYPPLPSSCSAYPAALHRSHHVGSSKSGYDLHDHHHHISHHHVHHGFGLSPSQASYYSSCSYCHEDDEDEQCFNNNCSNKYLGSNNSNTNNDALQCAPWT